ncbi:MAG: hypothetical protein FI717_05030 [SAR202 cluster bacterium]|nr:hypothetical protein [Chloroflexota bacterium]MQF95236.1 hypothetical protein [SAR202 cluster bacterium]HAA95749.1 hypothetical protein [Dehalococcoidia bacterium]MBO19723.1 hypothetical protein [Chloroflexota bacterium]MQG33650.1 hypothetical protein [SAR202 cluster bacterium]|tara:strand:- start:369 stop:656 length:288 start_codon:yes stop_codon:yes gene_type:complete
MRICSFLPSATEMVYDLGLQDSLYGVTHECDYPPEARNKPHVVHSVFEGMAPTSGEISKVISDRLAQGLGIYDIDEKLLQEAEPDLLITQAICEV